MAASRAEQRERTSARIADQAQRLFAERGYDRTTVRGIAAAAAVDPALVLHYFGSKRALFRAVIAGSDRSDGLGAPSDPRAASDPIGDPTEFVLANLRGKLDDHSGAVLSQLRSILTNQDAADHARAQLTRIADALSAELPERGELPEYERPTEPTSSTVHRAHLLLATTLGVTIARQLLAIDELTELPADEIASLLRPAVEALVRG